MGATFGRGFYVLDDYSALRHLDTQMLARQATLLPVRDAWWYVPYVPMQAKGKPTLGSTDYTGENPPFGATFTYYINDVPGTERQRRQKTEETLRNQGAKIPFPGWDALQREATEGETRVLLMVRDSRGEPVRWVEGPAEPGLHRVSWDLRRPPPNPVNLSTPAFTPPWVQPPQGPLAAPGSYRVELVMVTSAGAQTMGSPQEFNVKPVPTAPPGTDFLAVTAFQREASELMRQVSSASSEISRAQNRLRHMRAALLETPNAHPALFARLDSVGYDIEAIRTRLSGDRIRQGLNEATVPSIQNRIGRVTNGHWGTRQTPTETQRRNLEIARNSFGDLRRDLSAVLENKMAQIETDLEAAGAPWTPGRTLPPNRLTVRPVER